MKNMNSVQENHSVKKVSKNTGENNAVNKQILDKERAYLSLLKFSANMNFWGEGFRKDEEWSL